MIPKPLSAPDHFWSPKLSRFWVGFWRPFRLSRQRSEQRLEQIEVRGLEHLQSAIENYEGAMITPNHPGSADPFTMYHVADQVACPFFFMAAWQTFGCAPWYQRLILRQHGVFSVDREGTDSAGFQAGRGNHDQPQRAPGCVSGGRGLSPERPRDALPAKDRRQSRSALLAARRKRWLSCPPRSSITIWKTPWTNCARLWTGWKIRSSGDHAATCHWIEGFIGSPKAPWR